MGSFSIWHWLIVLAVVVLLFGGGGKIPRLMKDVGTGIKQFKTGLKDDDKKADGDGDGDDDAKAIGKDSAAASSTVAPSENKKAANG
ncbi:MAG: twin-arginine translocase TatA/TatE family subunit [Tistlia sp.]|uniref:twin-arginine translocase TatA/TatE family subunit n=1 Tax=Tistlia sp. TaxID=3057121 RepID=UPI0034A2EA41